MRLAEVNVREGGSKGTVDKRPTEGIIERMERAADGRRTVAIGRH